MGEFTKKPYRVGIGKKGGLGSLQIEGELGKNKGMVFLRGG